MLVLGIGRSKSESIPFSITESLNQSFSRIIESHNFNKMVTKESTTKTVLSFLSMVYQLINFFRGLLCNMVYELFEKNTLTSLFKFPHQPFWKVKSFINEWNSFINSVQLSLGCGYEGDVLC